LIVDREMQGTFHIKTYQAGLFSTSTLTNAVAIRKTTSVGWGAWDVTVHELVAFGTREHTAQQERPNNIQELRMPTSSILATMMLAVASGAVTFGDEPYQGTATYPLSYQCDGLKGTCNADFCTVVSTAASCAFTARTPVDGAAQATCQTCTQELADPRCTTANLAAAVHRAGGQVSAAYCTDKFLVLHSTGMPSWEPNLGDVPMPPGGDGGCVTRTYSAEGRTFKIPLAAGSGAYELLATSHRSNNNNAGAFPSGGGDGAEMYLCTDDRGAFGLPSAGPAGATTDGQDIYPVFNNGAFLTPSFCEVDSCNEHVGQGGGPPHLHGDPFGPKCLYNQSDFLDGRADAHPPITGWSLDGPTIYGRYLDLSAPGGRIELDDCGGHIHDGMPYHYHARIRPGKANKGSRGDPALIGTDGSFAEFPAFPNGPDLCWKADISKQASFWDEDKTGEITGPCCGMTNYYAKAGVSLNGAGVLDTTSYCALPTDFGLGISGDPATSTPCVLTGSLKSGSSCGVACATGYTGSTSTFSCTNGALTAPTLTCTLVTGHVFSVTPAEVCTTCTETTACVSVMADWLIAVIVISSLLGAALIAAAARCWYLKKQGLDTKAIKEDFKGFCGNFCGNPMKWWKRKGRAVAEVEDEGLKKGGAGEVEMQQVVVVKNKSTTEA
jgi:hypothetical protein